MNARTLAILASVYNVAAAHGILPRNVATPKNVVSLWLNTPAHLFQRASDAYNSETDNLYSEREVAHAFIVSLGDFLRERAPSDVLCPIGKGESILPPVGARRTAFMHIMEAGRLAFPDMEGLVYVTSERAFFQRVGDATRYSVAISESEYRTLTGKADA